jgi:hypothetical protein
MSEPLEPGLKALDEALRGVRFEPRASLGPELEGRVRRGERAQPSGWFRHRRGIATVAAGLALATGAAVAVRSPSPIMVDRCCYDLDGGGDADDGVRLLTQRDSRVHRLWVYEDSDGSGDFSGADVVRLSRGSTPAVAGLTGDGLVTLQRCCLDFDGGGLSDDGLLVIGVPPDRVVMAAIYERGPDERPSSPQAYPLR